MKMRLGLCSLAAGSVLWAAPAAASTLSVGPGKKYAGIADAMPDANPGDVIEVQGGNTYPGMIWLREDQGGTKDQPVTIRGIKVEGKRPVLSGVGSGQYENIILLLNANHVVMEMWDATSDLVGVRAPLAIAPGDDDCLFFRATRHQCRKSSHVVRTYMPPEP